MMRKKKLKIWKDTKQYLVKFTCCKCGKTWEAFWQMFNPPDKRWEEIVAKKRICSSCRFKEREPISDPIPSCDLSLEEMEYLRARLMHE